MKIKYFKCIQPLDNVYITIISGKELYKRCRSDIRRISEKRQYIGIERELSKSRVKEIQQFINTTYAALPNSIILNVTSDHIIIDDIEQTILLKDVPDIFEVLDGQHRINGFADSQQDFEVPVSIYVDLDESSKAIIFNNINFEQKPVSSSLSLELEALFPVYTPEKMLRNIVVKLNFDSNSPYYEKIKLRGLNDEFSPAGIISMNTFVEAMINRVYLTSKKHLLRDTLIRRGSEYFDVTQDIFVCNYFHTSNHFLWGYYFYNKENVLYRIILNYLQAFQFIFPNDFSMSDSLLMKAVGFNAIFLVFEYVYKKGVIDSELSKSYFIQKLSVLRKFDNTINSTNYGSSLSESRKIANMFIDALNLKF